MRTRARTSRGAPAFGPNGGNGSYGRGLISAGRFWLYDNWNFSSGGPWNTKKWTATSNDSQKVVDVQSNTGRLYVNGSSARATAKTPAIVDSDVTFTYRFGDRGSRSYFRPMIRGSGASGNSQMTNGYRLEFRSDSATVKLQEVVSGTSATLDEFTHTMDTNTQKVRFQAIGSTIRAKVWAVGSSEPATWSLETTDTSISTAGVFQLSHNFSSGARAVFIDDIAVDIEDVIFTGQADWGIGSCSSSNAGQLLTDSAAVSWRCNGSVWLWAGGVPNLMFDKPTDPCGASNDGEDRPSIIFGFNWICANWPGKGWDWGLVEIWPS